MEEIANLKKYLLTVHPVRKTGGQKKEFRQWLLRELKRADQVVLAEIYAARERNTFGISSRDLAAEIPGAVYLETLPEVTAYLKSNAQPGDILLTVGAGDIYKAGEALLK